MINNSKVLAVTRMRGVCVFSLSILLPSVAPKFQSTPTQPLYTLPELILTAACLALMGMFADEKAQTKFSNARQSSYLSATPTALRKRATYFLASQIFVGWLRFYCTPSLEHKIFNSDPYVALKVALTVALFTSFGTWMIEASCIKYQNEEPGNLFDQLDEMIEEEEFAAGNLIY